QNFAKRGSASENQFNLLAHGIAAGEPLARHALIDDCDRPALQSLCAIEVAPVQLLQAERLEIARRGDMPLRKRLRVRIASGAAFQWKRRSGVQPAQWRRGDGGYRVRTGHRR